MAELRAPLRFCAQGECLTPAQPDSNGDNGEDDDLEGDQFPGVTRGRSLWSFHALYQ